VPRFDSGSTCCEEQYGNDEFHRFILYPKVSMQAARTGDRLLLYVEVDFRRGAVLADFFAFQFHL
jgi:hypothetical protein